MTTDELRRLLAEATPGPWFDDYGKVGAGDRGIGEMDETADAALIVATVNALPGLLDVADAARRTVASDMTGGHRLLRDALARLDGAS